MKTSPYRGEIFNYIAWRKDLGRSAGLEGRIRRIIQQQNKAIGDKQSCFLAYNLVKYFIELLPDLFG